MNRSIPVITFLTSNVSTSLRARDALCHLFGSSELADRSLCHDTSLSAYNELFGSSIVLGLNGAILHLLPLDGNAGNNKEGSLSLLSVTQHPTEDDGNISGLVRQKLCQYLCEKHSHAMLIKTKIVGSKLFQRNVDIATIASSVFFDDDVQMIVDLPINEAECKTEHDSLTETSLFPHLQLKEVVIPFFPSLNESSISKSFSRSSLKRPKNPMTGFPMIGLYSWQSNKNNVYKQVCFRPIPAAREDRSLPNPTLVFHSSSSLEEQEEKLLKEGLLSVSKIGFSGAVSRGNHCSQRGQLSLSHRDLCGIDLRLCESSQLSTGFPEAQEALLASSLNELQSTNVLNEGGGRRHNKNDSMNGLGDCWVEFRANMKYPGGFLGKKSRAPVQTTRIAKSPDLPYE